MINDLEELTQYWPIIRDKTTQHLRKTGILTSRQHSLPANMGDAAFLGCGFWGCVWECQHNPRFVIKLTFDPVEGPIVNEIIKHPLLRYHPGSTYYHAVWAIPTNGRKHVLPEQFMSIRRVDGVQGYLIVRENAQPADAACRQCISDEDSRRFGLVSTRWIRKRRDGVDCQEEREGWLSFVNHLYRNNETAMLAEFIFSMEQDLGVIIRDVHCGNIGERVFDLSDVCGEPLNRGLILLDVGHSGFMSESQLPFLDVNGSSIKRLY